MSITRTLHNLVSGTTLVALVAGAGAAAMALPNEDFQGRPKFKVGAELGAFVWHDEDGQHVRFTTKGKIVRKFSGKVCGEKVVKLDPFELEPADSASIGPEGHCVHFDFTTDGAVDGFDFRAEGAVLTYDFQQDGTQMAVGLIRIGAKNKHPNQSPFVLNRM